MLTTREQLTVLDHLINLKLQVKMYPPYHKDAELMRIKKKLEEDIMLETKQFHRYP